MIDQGKVKDLTVSGGVISGTLSEKMPDGKSAFTTLRVAPDLADILTKHGVTYSATASGRLLTTLLSWIMPPLLFVGVWLLASRTMGGGGID